MTSVEEKLDNITINSSTDTDSNQSSDETSEEESMTQGGPFRTLTKLCLYSS